jgi:hypothetical protein
MALGNTPIGVTTGDNFGTTNLPASMRLPPLALQGAINGS